MREHPRCYLDRQWADPVELRVTDVASPATERFCSKLAIGSSVDFDDAGYGFAGIQD